MVGFSIGQVAGQAGLTVETVRFYEREGLIPSPPRRSSGYRDYPPQTVRRLRFIRRAKELGFTLAEIGELLSLRLEAGSPCTGVQTLAADRLADIEQRIADLVRMREALDGLLQSCRGDGQAAECPILEAIDPAGEQA